MNDAQDQAVRDHIAAEVRAELARQKMSVSEAARRLGWQQTFLQRRVMGSRTFEASELVRLAQLLEVPVGKFFPDEAVISQLSGGIMFDKTSPAPDPGAAAIAVATRVNATAVAA